MAEGYGDEIIDWRDPRLQKKTTVIGDTSHTISFQEMSLIIDRIREGKVTKTKNISGVFVTIQLT